jgi:hypothetical protein
MLAATSVRAAEGKSCQALRADFEAALNGPRSAAYDDFSSAVSEQSGRSRDEYLAACNGAGEYEKMRRALHAREAALVTQCGSSGRITGGKPVDKSSLDALFADELAFIRSNRESFCAYAQSEAGSEARPSRNLAARGVPGSGDPPERCIELTRESETIWRFRNLCAFAVTFSYLAFETSMKMTYRNLSIPSHKSSDRFAAKLDESLSVAAACKASDRDCVGALEDSLKGPDSR